jgi:DNA-binding transcriptional ArsR family regulator
MPTRSTAAAPALEVVRGAGRASVMLQPTRRRLLLELLEADSAAGLSRRLGLPRQRLNYHLRALEREGLVELVDERRKGNCVERLVRATARSFVISPEVLGTLGTADHAPRDRFSASYLMTAAAQTLRDVAVLDARARREGKRLATFTLDVNVRFASADRRTAFAQALADSVAALAAKYHDEQTPGGRRFRLVASIHPAVDPAGPPDRDARKRARR